MLAVFCQKRSRMGESALATGYRSGCNHTRFCLHSVLRCNGGMCVCVGVCYLRSGNCNVRLQCLHHSALAAPIMHVLI